MRPNNLVKRGVGSKPTGPASNLFFLCEQRVRVFTFDMYRYLVKNEDLVVFSVLIGIKQSRCWRENSGIVLLFRPVSTDVVLFVPALTSRTAGYATPDSRIIF